MSSINPPDNNLSDTEANDDMTTTCPHCLVSIFIHPSRKDLGADADGQWSAICSKCPNCDKMTIYLRRHEHFSASAHSQPFNSAKLVGEFLVYPKSIQRNPPPPQVPEEFTKDYREAALIINGSPKASAALSRRLLQHILREKAGADQRNLVDAINHVITQGNVPSHVSDSLHTLREIGNFAAHPTKSANTAEILEVEPGEAEWCLDVIDALYDHYFVAPDKALEAKKAINEKRLEAGLKPIP